MNRDASPPGDPDLDELAEPSLMDDLRYFLVLRKRWWLGGTILVISALVGLIVLANGGEPIDPFVYDH